MYPKIKPDGSNSTTDSKACLLRYSRRVLGFFDPVVGVDDDHICAPELQVCLFLGALSAPTFHVNLGHIPRTMQGVEHLGIKLL